MEDYGVRGAVHDLVEDLIPGLRSKRLRDEKSAEEQKRVLEVLAEEGIKVLGLSDVSRKTRKKAREIKEWGLRNGRTLRYGSDYIVLYDGESPEIMDYTVALGSDVINHIKGETINRILEVLTKEGIKVLGLSDVSRKTRKKAKEFSDKGLRYGSDFISLYDGESPELMYYTVALGPDVMNHIKGETINKILEVAQNGKEIQHKYDDISHVLHMSKQLMPENLRPDTHGEANHKTFYWLEDPRKTQDTGYLQDLVLGIEGALSRPEIIAVESMHKVKLEPEFIATRRPVDGFSLIVNYHLKKE